MNWTVEHHHATAAELHGLGVPLADVRRTVRFNVPTRRALVLGSTQSVDDVVPGAAERFDIEVAKRRSGGGAVLVDPQDIIWVDLVIPSDDPLWQVDVGRAFHWLGSVWAEVLGGDAVAYEGPLLTNRWSRRVCFAGLGPGEVTIDGQKVVGISQRRTREGALFQCSLYRRFDVDLTVSMLVDDPLEAAELSAYLRSFVAEAPALASERLQAALLAKLPTS